MELTFGHRQIIWHRAVHLRHLSYLFLLLFIDFYLFRSFSLLFCFLVLPDHYVGRV